MIAESMTNTNDIPENKNTTTILQNPNLEASKSTVDESSLCIKSGPPLQKTKHKDPITNYSYNTADEDENTSDIEVGFGENSKKQCREIEDYDRVFYNEQRPSFTAKIDIEDRKGMVKK